MATIQPADEKFMQPSWGAYLYQNYLQSSASPDGSLDWLNHHQHPLVPGQLPPQPSQPAEYSFGLAGSAWPSASGAGTSPTAIKTEVLPSPPQTQHLQLPPSSDAAVYTQGYYYPTGISTSLLTQHSSAPSSVLSLTSQLASTESLNLVDHHLTRSPSPVSSHLVSPHASPCHLPAKTRDTRGRTRSSGGAAVKRSHSLHSDSDLSHHSHDEHDEHDHDVPEGVERDGMIWGMKVEDYRALSARERKRVRNRISARTFRAKRKEHLSSLEHDRRLANEETARLRREVIELKRRLAKYENAYGRGL
ncbi:hypothetical protein IAT38_000833 [Cryptococcus sp. DSM 104549]